MAASSDSSSSGFSSTSVAEADPITRNALRYTISASEYKLLHQYLLSRTPVLKDRTPRPEKREAPSYGKEDPEDYNAATIRLTARLFLGSYAGLKLWEVIKEKILKRVESGTGRKTAFYRNPDFRLSLSLSSIFFFHRFLFRFFTRLRTSLRTEDAKPFRRRNPRIWKALTSKLAPAMGASTAGLFLGLSSADQTRVTITLYFFLRALEFSYENLQQRGYLKSLPKWFGMWMVLPPVCGQLLHAFFFDRDCFPESYGRFILTRSPGYIAQRPADYPAGLPWPKTYDILDSLGEISMLKWPAFVSPILFPQAKTLPASLTKIAPVIGPAHPAIKRLSCAVLHPNDPSCLRMPITYYVRAFPTMAKFWTLVYCLFALPRYRTFIKMPLAAVNRLAEQILRASVFYTSAIGTAWASVCLMNHILPGHVLSTKRWMISGFLAGLWAYIDRSSGRAGYLQYTRTSLDSLWRVGKKRGWWKGIKNGDVLLFTASLAVTGCLYERDPKFVSDKIGRKCLSLIRGEGYVDRCATSEERKKSITGGSEGAEEKKQA